MRTPELRSQIRMPLAQQPEGALVLHAGGVRFPVHAIRDISQAGVCLLLDGDVGNAVQFSIDYRNRDIEVSVSGSIVWSRQSESRASDGTKFPVCMLGANLVSPHLLPTFMQDNWA